MLSYEIFFFLQVKTSFKEFATVVCDDPRSATLDAGNVKLTYNALIEKVCFCWQVIFFHIVSVCVSFVIYLYIIISTVSLVHC